MRDLKKLLRKEFRLAASPLTYWFMAGALFVLIPNYPILVGAFFVSLGIFYSFQSARESNDVLYSVLLPLAKRDFVRAKFAFVTLIQLLSFLAFALMAALWTALLAGRPPYDVSALMRPNLALLGYVLLIYALFDLIFLRGFFRTAYAIGKPFLLFSVLTFLFIALTEVLHRLPGLGFLNAPEGGLAGRAAVFGASLLLYLAALLFSWKKAEKSFEKIDL